MTMNSEFFLYMTYLVTLVELTLGLYLFVNNPRKPVSRNIVLLLIVAALNGLGLGLLSAAQKQADATLATALLAFSTLSLQPLLILTSFSILKPVQNTPEEDRALPPGRWTGLAAGGLYFLALLPLLLVLFDLTISGGFQVNPGEGLKSPPVYYSGVDPATYPGGYVALSTYTQGMLGMSMRILYLVALPVILLGMLLYRIIFDQSLVRRDRRLAAAQIISVVIAAPILLTRGDPNTAIFLMLIPGILYAVVYAYTAYQQLQESSLVQRGSLVTRITLLVLVVSLPLMVALVVYTSSRAGTLISDGAYQALRQQNETLGSNIETWLDLNNRILENLALQADIRSMDPIRQTPSLQAAASAFPYMDVISISDPTGLEIARSDDREVENNRARLWFSQVMGGEPLAYQILLGQSGKPVLIVARPVRDAANNLVGVIMFAAALDEISQQLQTVARGQTGTIFLVDDQNQLIAHPDPKITSWLRDYSDYPPVQKMRAGQAGLVHYVCANLLCSVQDEPRTAFVSLLSNEWGLVVEQSDTELLAPLRQVQQLAFIMLVIGLLLFAAAVTYTVRRGLAPVKILTDTVAAIAEGDLDRRVPLESGSDYSTTDELGFLAQTFNMMTVQLKELVGGLEHRVEERTEDVKKRSVQLEAAAQVARASAGIRDLRELLTQATQLISSTFGFYHSGIFIIDDAREFAILQASNSPGGQKMLDRGHKLKIGQVGIVGFVASTAEPRIALDVGVDAVYFNNPDLPETRSEMALPLIVNQQVIGVLDVQSQQASAFKPEDLDVLQILADQLALAIENARLLEETNRAFNELQTIYGERTREDWQDRLRGGPIVYEYNRLGVEQRSKTGLMDNVEDNLQSPADFEPNSIPVPEVEPSQRLEVPITLRDHQLGAITFLRDADLPAWTEEEQRVVGEAVTQISAALENARLLEESQARSTQLRLLQEVTAVAASHTNLIDLLVNVSRRLRIGLGMMHCGVLLVNQQSWGADDWRDAGRLVTNDCVDPNHSANQMVGRSLPLFSPDPDQPTVFDIVRQERKTTVLRNAAKIIPPGAILDFVVQRGTATLLVSPLITNDQVIGFLVMDSIRADRYYADEDLQLLDQLSLQISSAIDMASTFEQTTRRAEREKKTSEITSRIRETLDIDIILRTAAQEVRQLLDVPEVTVQLVNPEEETNASVKL